jgi:hypothetical protein
MRISVPIGRIMRPSGIAISAVLLSFCAWLCPDFGVLRKGFTVAEHPGMIAWFILLSWYGLIFASLSVGQRLAGLFVGEWPKNGAPSIDSAGVYRIFTFLAAFGTIMTLIRIFQTLSIPQAAIYFYIGQGNRIKNALYENYGAGILSLRYLVVYSAALAIYRTIKFRKLTLLNVVNLVLLAAAALISSRLILIATLLTSGFLVTLGKGHVRISVLKLVTWLAMIFGVLSLLNVSRNRSFYDKHDLSFTQAGISEIVTYLGSPFHVALGAARRLDEITAGAPELYREYIDIEPELSTNSAFVHLHAEMGYMAWPYICLICCFMGFVFSWLASLGNTSFLLPCGAILYACAELWRLDLFQQGIFIVWFVSGIGIPALFTLFNTMRLSETRESDTAGLAGPQP